MRSKFKKSIIFIRQFWSHDQFVSRKNDHEIETLNSIIRQFRSHDQSVDLLIIIIEQIWSHEQIEFRSHEKVEFWSHEIRPHDYFLPRIPRSEVFITAMFKIKSNRIIMLSNILNQFYLLIFYVKRISTHRYV